MTNQDYPELDERKTGERQPAGRGLEVPEPLDLGLEALKLEELKILGTGATSEVYLLEGGRILKLYRHSTGK